ncbi:14390_t:CDS:2, partial [Funneliformis mosseae]
PELGNSKRYSKVRSDPAHERSLIYHHLEAHISVTAIKSSTPQKLQPLATPPAPGDGGIDISEFCKILVCGPMQGPKKKTR